MAAVLAEPSGDAPSGTEGTDNYFLVLSLNVLASGSRSSAPSHNSFENTAAPSKQRLGLGPGLPVTSGAR